MNGQILRFLAALTVIALAAPAVAQVTDDDLRRARQEVDRIQRENHELSDRIQASWARQYELEAEIENLQASINHAQLRLVEVQARLEQVAVEMYMASTSGASMVAMLRPGTGERHAGLQYLRNVSGADENLIDQLRSFRNQLDAQTERLMGAIDEQRVLEQDLAEMGQQLNQQLAAAQVFFDVLTEQRRKEEEQRRIREEEERRAEELRIFLATSTTAAPATTTTAAPVTTTTAAPVTTTTPAQATTTTAAPVTTTTAPPPPPSDGLGACPVDGPVAFSDTWGAPRSGGRTHQGVDMMAARGTPIVAIYDGVIHRTNPVDTGLGGITVWLRRANGDLFYYAHLDGLADISPGQTVTQGQLLGWNGSTGNASDLFPHLHFEYHPGGGPAVNPYPLVRSLC
jgi:peptidoglycan LD-endopeptidase LytH